MCYSDQKEREVPKFQILEAQVIVFEAINGMTCKAKHLMHGMCSSVEDLKIKKLMTEYASLEIEPH